MTSEITMNPRLIASIKTKNIPTRFRRTQTTMLLLVLNCVACVNSSSKNCENIPQDTRLVHRAGDGEYEIHIILLPPGQHRLPKNGTHGIFWPISFDHSATPNASAERYHPSNCYVPGREYEIIVTPKIHPVEFNTLHLEAVYLTAVPSGTPRNQETHKSIGTFTPTICTSPNVGAVEIKYNFPRRIAFIWKAPRLAELDKVKFNDASTLESGRCLEIRATVVPWHWHRIYFRNTGGLKRTLCLQEDPRQIEHWPNYVSVPDASEKHARKPDGVSILSVQSDGNLDGTRSPYPHSDGGLYDSDEYGSCSVQEIPKPVRRCCACNTAVYRLVIQSDWQQQQHWRDWPAVEVTPNGKAESPHWTEILGASHSPLYDVFHAGGFASPAVDALCTAGDVSKLEGEFRNQAGESILTVIRTRGIDSGAPPKQRVRSALFAVNSTHHLVSFLTRLVPSTDWCTGLSRVDVCLPNCSWPLRMHFRLEPWDSGVMSGNTYVPAEPSERLREPKPMCPITPDLRPNTPFTVQTDYIPVQQLKTTANNVAPEFAGFSMDNSNHNPTKVKSDFNVPRKGPLFHKPHRILHPSTTRLRRTFVPLGSVEFELLRVNEHEVCSVEPDQEDQAFDHFASDKETGLEPEKMSEGCQLSSWTAWGPCLKVDPNTCPSPQARSYWSFKTPTKRRTRMILSPSTVVTCAGIPLKEEKSCHPAAVKVSCLTESQTTPTLSAESCQKLPWGQWSQCLNATCSRPGITYRWRQFPYPASRQSCELYSEVSQVNTCWPPPNKSCSLNEVKNACSESPPSAAKLCPTLPNATERYFFNPETRICQKFKYDPLCHLRAFMQQHELGYSRNVFHERSVCEEVCMTKVIWSTRTGKSIAKRSSSPCLMSLDVGHYCTSAQASKNWHFDQTKEQCIEFIYLGCGGNGNRFRKREQCEHECKLKFGPNAVFLENSKGSTAFTAVDQSSQSTKALVEMV